MCVHFRCIQLLPRSVEIGHEMHKGIGSGSGMGVPPDFERNGSWMWIGYASVPQRTWDKSVVPSLGSMEAEEIPVGLHHCLHDCSAGRRGWVCVAVGGRRTNVWHGRELIQGTRGI